MLLSLRNYQDDFFDTSDAENAFGSWQTIRRRSNIRIGGVVPCPDFVSVIVR